MGSMSERLTHGLSLLSVATRVIFKVISASFAKVYVSKYSIDIQKNIKTMLKHMIQMIFFIK